MIAPWALADTPAEQHIARIRIEISQLMASVQRADKPATLATASTIERELEALHQAIMALPPVRLSIAEQAECMRYVGHRIPGVRLVETLAAQRGIGEDLAALRASVVTERVYRLDERDEVSLRYYPRGRCFVAQDVRPNDGGNGADRLSSMDAQQRVGFLRSRAVELDAAWKGAHPMTLAVRPEIARRLGLAGTELVVRYAHTNVLTPDGTAGRTYEDMLREIQLQLEYVFNVKPEGPPLIAALQTGLFFDEAFGFEAWGGRWPEFDGTVFFLRYNATRREFLVNLWRGPRSWPGRD